MTHTLIAINRESELTFYDRDKCKEFGGFLFREVGQHGEGFRQVWIYFRQPGNRFFYDGSSWIGI